MGLVELMLIKWSFVVGVVGFMVAISHRVWQGVGLLKQWFGPFSLWRGPRKLRGQLPRHVLGVACLVAYIAHNAVIIALCVANTHHALVGQLAASAAAAVGAMVVTTGAVAFFKLRGEWTG